MCICVCMLSVCVFGKLILCLRVCYCARVVCAYVDVCVRSFVCARVCEEDRCVCMCLHV